MTDTDTINTPATFHGSRPSRVLWRVAGALALGHVVLLFAGFSQEAPAVSEHGVDPDKLRSTLLDGSFDRIVAGGYVESLSFLVLLPAIIFAATAIGQRTEVGRWAARTSLAAGVALVASTLAIGMPAGAAALYGARHGAGAETLMVVNDLRNYAFQLEVALMGLQALTLGIAALADRRHARWIGYGGVAVGLVALPGAALFHNVVSMVWIVWWVGVAVTFLRAREAS
jgi:hypothetical protein